METDQRPPINLTLRETQMLGFIADRVTNRQIAEELTISPKTVELHITNLLRKTGSRSRWEALETAQNLGLIPRTAEPTVPAPNRIRFTLKWTP